MDVQNTQRSNVVTTADRRRAPDGAESVQPRRCSCPGVTLTSFSGSNIQDVGGTRNMEITIFSVHGSRAIDQRLMVNGLTARNLLASAWASNFVPDMGAASEVAFDYSSGTADSFGAGFAHEPHPEGRRQQVQGVVLRHRRQRLVSGRTTTPRN